MFCDFPRLCLHEVGLARASMLSHQPHRDLVNLVDGAAPANDGTARSRSWLTIARFLFNQRP
jgi:hypothetical protein